MAAFTCLQSVIRHHPTREAACKVASQWRSSAISDCSLPKLHLARCNACQMPVAGHAKPQTNRFAKNSINEVVCDVN